MSKDQGLGKEPYRSLRRDRKVFDAVRERFASGKEIPGFGTLESREMAPELFQETMAAEPAPGLPLDSLEAIVLLTGRPVLLIQDDDFLPPDLEEMRARLEPRRKQIKRAIPSVGRLDVLGFGPRMHVGTAWMLDEDVMITNRHVANSFAAATGGRIMFRRRPSGIPFAADVDFYREYERGTEHLVKIDEVLYIEPDEVGRPDMALLRVEKSGKMPPPLPLASEGPQVDEDVATIGYPGNAPRSNNLTALEEYFEGIFGFKRLSPGRVSAAGSGGMQFNHDCTTLGGNSGSVVIRVETGEAIGLHFAGVPDENNYAVGVPMLRQRLAAIRQKFVSVPSLEPDSPPSSSPADVESRRITAAELADRRGYDTEFLGERLPLPTPTGELLKQVVPVGDRPDGVLDYIHYSLAMHRDRRLALFTACNIDGGKAFRVPRRSDPWQIDPRIGPEFQSDNELYARNTLDRGHLVRRLDTAWGETREDAVKAALDTFYYTNSTPQHSRLNQRIWLGLEDYVLDNADNNGLKVTVFSGPVFRDTDRTYRGWLIPEDFWKVLAFHNDSTGRLSATAYLLTQSDLLGDLEFLYGAYQTYQVPIAEIESLTSLDFHFLKQRDPMAAEGPLEGAPPSRHLIESMSDLLL